MADMRRNRGNESPNYGAPDTVGTSDLLDTGSTSSLDLGSLAQIVFRHSWVIIMTIVLLVGATIGFSLAQPPKYDASIKIIVGQGGKLTQDPVAQAGLTEITDTIVVAADTRPVAEGVIEELGLNKTPKEMLKDTSASRIGPTQFIEVTYSDTDPQRAQRVANTIGTVLSDKIGGLSPGSGAITASVWETAVIPDSPEDPDPIRNGVLAAIVGLLLGLGLALLLDYFGLPGGRQKRRSG